MTMDRQTIREEGIIERYIRNELSEEDAVAFEMYYLDKPDLVEELELEAMLHENLADAIAAPARKKHRPFLAVAATALVGMAVGMLVQNGFVDQQPSPLAAVEYQVVPAVRGEGTVETVVVGDLPVAVAIRIAGPGKVQPYRAELVRAADNQLIASIQGMTRLATGDAVLTVDPASGLTGLHTIRIRNKDGRITHAVDVAFPTDFD